MKLDKIARLQEGLKEEAMLFSMKDSLRYLTGRENLEGSLLIAREGIWFFTDFRYVEDAVRHLEAEVVDCKGRLKECILDVARDCGIKALLFEKEIPYQRYELYAGYFRHNGLEFRPGGSELEDLRMIKSDSELKRIRKSADINNRIFERILQDVRPGVTELELKLKLECYLRELGGHESSFDLMVLFGANSSMPHGMSGDTRLEAGMPILFDIGVRYRGYASDMTRMAHMGPPSPEFREAYDFVRGVQELALELVKPGAGARSVDEQVKAMLNSGGYNLEHSTGHGVGLEIHERPSLNSRSEDVLKPGMVITIEPGIYLQGRFGIRIEDLLIVGEESNEILTTIDKDLFIIE